ncbi:inactive polypeptide N-acetylgalactosaminyltransferase-like protein 5 [Liolophura sinensis]|uniref:inactive polypeptide N-acetylgalactosaminyltransferase-like protein 5 n=1 Tax=Liolophura sinensis TaxID=3198878 RepID=UPI003158E8A1
MRLSSRFAIAIVLALCVCISLYGVLIGKLGVGKFYQVPREALQKTGGNYAREAGTTRKSALESDFVVADIDFKYAKPQNGDIFPKTRPFLANGLERVTVTAEDFRTQPHVRTGNALIDEYGKNDLQRMGENGRGVTFVGEEAKVVQGHLAAFHVNVLASDLISLHRTVPDSRPQGCSHLKYPIDLPTASVVIPFHNEWPSVLIRTIYSILNRSPRHLLKDIVLVDDASDMPELGKPLDDYISKMFPEGIVKVVRLRRRAGLIKARLIGWKQTTGRVLVIFDSHMEVNHFWLEPLLYEIKQDRQIVALGTLDYISAKTFEYEFHSDYMTRYGFDWRLVFFETFFRRDLTWNLSPDQARAGVITVGTGFAVESDYFEEIGSYDEGMETWGGENIELGWRVWMCGGRMVHVPCSHIGHIARTQPYSFPKGRMETEVLNYKRAIDVWMDPLHKNLIYDHFPSMKTVDVGDISDRLEIKEKLHCKNFTWFLDTIWPELTVFPENAQAWGGVSNRHIPLCLDNDDYLFQAEQQLFAKSCTYKVSSQSFSLKESGQFRTSLQCVVVKETRVALEDCLLEPNHEWKHEKNGQLLHVKSNLCLDLEGENPVMKACDPSASFQTWTFQHYKA